MINHNSPGKPKRLSNSSTLFVLFTLVFSSAPAFRLAAAPAEQAPTQLQQSPDALLKAMEAPVQENYVLDAGDELTVEVVGRPELSGKHTIGPDGQISLPISGPLCVAGKTRIEASNAVTAALAKYYDSLNVIVRVDKYGSNKIYLMGKTSTPGVMLFDGVPTLLEAISRGGVLAGDPKTWPTKIAVFRGKDMAIWFDLRTMLDAGSSTLQIRLMRNDVVYVPGELENYATVLGEVAHPGVVQINRDLTVADALAMTGGLSDKAAKNSIQLIRKVNGQTRELSLAEVLHGRDGGEALLQPGDVVYIPRSGVSKFEHLLQTMTPIGMMMTLVAIQ